MLKTLCAAMLAAGVVVAGPAMASVADPVGDFLGTYGGPLNPDLDILGAEVEYDGSGFRLSATLAGPVGVTPGSLYVWGINRGGGTARLAGGSPSVGPTVLFDSVAVMFPDGLGRAVTFPTAGPPSITPLSGIVNVTGNTISALFPAALFPTNGFAADDYTFTLWSRKRVNPALDGTNAEIADFASAITPTRPVPEPTTWALMILGTGAVGLALRRRRPAGA